MAQWFHRNPFKATTAVNFLLTTGGNPETCKFCGELKLTRKRLLELLVDPNQASSTIEELYKIYLALLSGFLFEVDEKEKINESPSKLRHCFLFKWTHTLLGNVPQSVQDAVYEAASISVNIAVWHMKHAAMIAAKDEVSVEQAKEIHSELKLAASIFKFVEDIFLPKFIGKPLSGSDFDSRVLKAYLNQCIAEAQEGKLTFARAVELKHNPNLISAIANENSKRFLTAFTSLDNSKAASQWKTYLKLKSTIYLAYAYCFLGENLLSQDKCGEAIKALQESKKYHSEALIWCNEYSKIKHASSKIKPESHLFFRRLSFIINLSLDKCERENSLIYHQRIPNEVPVLDSQCNFGIVSPEQLSYPEQSSLWTPSFYATFPCKNIKREELTISVCIKVELITYYGMKNLNVENMPMNDKEWISKYYLITYYSKKVIE
ncbi:hypothetical protein J437_LFUL018834 [Ladona fulva]|uniref:BRO1 domain-containing protein n=1 Tax=Ladona fulva TaxID=123851 RepID=A0A8K0NXT8_LADFU|nr:hypothetical protein J437_LFUL018834 [Ladona fulva]